MIEIRIRHNHVIYFRYAGSLARLVDERHLPAKSATVPVGLGRVYRRRQQVLGLQEVAVRRHLCLDPSGGRLQSHVGELRL